VVAPSDVLTHKAHKNANSDINLKKQIYPRGSTIPVSLKTFFLIPVPPIYFPTIAAQNTSILLAFTIFIPTIYMV